MTKDLPSSLNSGMSAAEVAGYLFSQLGEKPAYWLTWLANERKPNRVNRRLPALPGPGRPRYDATMVESFVAEYKKMYALSGARGVRNGVKSTRLVSHISAMTVAAGADHAAVLFVIAKPLASFLLDANEARNIAARLIKAADDIESEGADVVDRTLGDAS